MSFIDKKTAKAAANFTNRYFPFKRAERLRAAFEDCVTDYYTKRLVGEPFEAKGILVTAPSRTGKTHEVKHLLKQFNAAEEVMPDGKPAHIIRVILAGRMTWKDLGYRILEKLDYPVERTLSQARVWETVRQQAQKLGVIGIHFDECQHVFSNKRNNANEKFLDEFKTLMKDPDWPFMLILSGVPELEGFVFGYEQLAYLLKPVRMFEIKLAKDLNELNELCYSLAEAAEIEFGHLTTPDFYARLAHSGAYRWGLVIELFIAALVEATRANVDEMNIEHFQAAYRSQYEIDPSFSPFVVDDFRNCINPAKLLELRAKVEHSS